MRKFSLLIVFVLACCSNMLIAQTIPFGTNTDYGIGYLPTTVTDQDALDAYNNWKNSYFVNCGTNQIRVDDGGKTVSEGQGYGMVLAAYAGEQDVFDKLARFWIAKRDSDFEDENGVKHSTYLMNWNVSCNGTSGNGGATDGDEDAAMGLLVAAAQWPGEGFDGKTYEEWTKLLVDDIWEFETASKNGRQFLKPGNRFLYSESVNCMNPSYFAPAYFRAFAEFTGESKWEDLANSCVQTLNANMHPTTGLNMAWCDIDGGTSSGCAFAVSGGGTADQYQYDACRTPWRFATEYLWWQNADVLPYLEKLTNWVNHPKSSMGNGATGAGGIASITAVYNQNGTTSKTNERNSAFVGAFCNASLASDQSSSNSFHDFWVKNSITQGTPQTGQLDDKPYFQNTLKVLYMFLSTGNFWNPMGNQCAKPDLGDDVSICGLNKVTLDTKLNSNGKLYTWKNSSGTTLSGNGPTLDVATAGVYTVIMDSADCSKEDKIEVLGFLPDVDLGDDIELCDPAMVTLDAGVASPVISYSWKKGSKEIATSKTLLISEAGDYKITISASNCTDEKDSVTVTSLLPVANHDTVCAAGPVSLSVDGNGSYQWWNDEVGGDTPLSTGNKFEPAISQNSTYWVNENSSFSTSVGPKTGLGSYSNHGFPTNYHLSFTAYSDFTINSFKIPCDYWASTGTITVEVLDENGNSLNPKRQFTSESLTIPNTGTNGLIQFEFSGFDIKKSWGTNLRLGLVSKNVININPKFSGSGATYPYKDELGGTAVEITGSVQNGNASSSQYMFFYDWDISAGVSCARRPVNAVIDANHPDCSGTTCSAPISIDLDKSSGMVCLGGDVVIKGSFTGTAVDMYYISVIKGGVEIISPTPMAQKSFELPLTNILLANAGDYTIRIEDGNNDDSDCYLETTYSLTVNEFPEAVITTSDLEYCENGSGVELVAKSVADATYKWSTNGTTRKIQDNKSGKYTVEVTKEGCTSKSTEVTVLEKSLPVAEITTTNLEYCENEAGVELVAKSVADATYKWSTNGTTRIIQGNKSGKYTVEVTKEGCSATSPEVTVLEKVLPEVEITTTDLEYCENESGVELVAKSVADATYKWSTNVTTRIIQDNKSGKYSVEVTKDGCSATSPEVTVVEKALPEAEITTTDLEYCENESGVELVAKSVADATYKWSTNVTTRIIQDNKSGKYSVEVTKDGCSATSAEVTVVENSLPEAVITTTNLSYCEGGDGVALAAKPVSGATYKWSSGETEASISNKMADDYTVTVTKGECSATSEVVTVSKISSGSVTVVENGLSFCTGESVTLEASVAGATYKWSNGKTTQSIEAAAAGKYSVEVTENGCKAISNEVTVVEKTLPEAEITTTVLSYCENALGVALSAKTVSGATYLWSNGEKVATTSKVSAGKYSVEVTKGGCSATSDEVTVSTKALPVAEITTTNLSYCEGGNGVALDAKVVSGATYKWSSGETVASLSNKLEGDYSVQVTKNNCSSISDVVTVSEISSGSVTVVENGLSFCTGESVTLEASVAGANYKWSNGATTQTIEAVLAGKYSVEVTKNGCKATSNEVTVSEKTLPEAEITSTVLDYCADASGVELVAKSVTDATYKWSNNETTRKIQGTAGKYSVEVTKDGCSATSAEVTVNTKALPVAEITTTDLSYCEGGNGVALAAKVVSGATYKWSSGETLASITNKMADDYSVTVSKNGCSATSDEVTVSEISSGSVTVVENGLSFCTGESVMLEASVAGANYKWSNGATTQSIEAASAGKYFVEVTKNGCKATSEMVTVSEKTLPEAVITSMVLDYCENESGVELLAQSVTGATYKWNTNATTNNIQNAKAGKYSVEVTKDGCAATSNQVTVVEKETPIAEITTTDLSYCEGGNGVTLAAKVVSGATYKWSSGETSASITNKTAGEYSITVSNNGCSAISNEVTVSEIASGSVTIIANETSVCSGESVVLEASVSGATYKWSNGATTQSINVNNGGKYSVTVTKGGCEEVSNEVTITENVKPEATITSTELTFCSNEKGVSLVAKEVSGAAYKWSSGEGTRTISEAGEGAYFVTVSKDGCSSKSATVNVTQTAVPLARITSSDFEYCSIETGVSLTAKAVSGATYTWSNEDEGRVIENVKSGEYTVTVTKNGCESISKSVIVYETITPVVDHISGVDSLCNKVDPTQLYIASTSSTVSGFTWTVGNDVIVNSTSNTSSLEVDFGQVGAGVSIISVVAENNGCESIPYDLEVLNKCTLTSSSSYASTEFQLYPNPIHNSVHIELPQSVQVLGMNILNESGQLINAVDRNYETALLNLDGGMYVVQFITADRMIVKKVIKE